MWFTLECVSLIDNLKLQRVRSFLISESSSSDLEHWTDAVERSGSEEGSVSEWDNWGSEESSTPVAEEMEDKTGRAKSSSSWLEGTIIASTPSDELLVFALANRFALLRSKPQYSDTASASSRDDISSMSVVGADQDFMVVALRESEHKITSVLCLPLASSQKSSTHLPDWIAVVLGTEDGFLLFYTDRGTLIYKQQFTSSPVLSLDFGTVLHGAQELSAFHGDSCLITIEGLSLFTALKGCKNQVAKSASTLEELSEVVDLMYKKFSLDSVEEGVSHVCSGPYKPGTFDQLEAATLRGGFYARVNKPSLPHYSTYCVIGSSPLLDFSWLDDSGNQPGFTDALYNLADKFKSTLASQVPSGILGYWNSYKQNPSVSKKKAVDVRCIQMPCRTLLRDANRQGERVCLSANGSLAAVADAQARVLLVLTKGRVIVRMWKGYRDAQCGWIETSGEVGEREGRAVFLVIFAPRRGLLEVWSAQNGPRVGAWNVDRRGRLISASTPLTLGGGLSDCHSAGVSFLSSNGELFDVKVPFRAALQDETIAQSHDMHIMKDFKARLVEPNEVQLLSRLLGEFMTVSYLRQAFELALSTESVTAAVLGILVEKILSITSAEVSTTSCSDDSSSRQNNSSVEATVFRSHCLAYKQLINLYALIQNRYYSDELEVSSSVSESTSSEDFDAVARLLCLSVEELERFIHVLEMCTRIRGVAQGVRSASGPFSIQAMMRCYDFSALLASREVCDEQDCLAMRLGDSSFLELGTFGNFIFKPVLTGQCSFATLKGEILLLLGLKSEDLLRLLLAHWLGEVHRYSAHPGFLYQVLLHIIQEQRDGVGSLFWMIEKQLADTTNVPEAFTLCLVLRGVGKNLLTTNERREEESVIAGLPSDWEEIQISVEKWDILISNFYALLLLDGLQHDAIASNEDLSSMFAKVSFGEFLLSGSGYYREQFGRCLAATKWGTEEVSSALSCDGRSPTSDKILWNRLVSELGQQFPKSFSQDLVFADGSWEQGSLWQKFPEDIERLVHCLQVLSAIEHPALRHGVSFLLWETFVKERFMKLCALVDKVKKFPKDRQCRKEVGISESRVIPFSNCCADLLKILWQANSEHEFGGVLIFPIEDFIQNMFTLPDYKYTNGCGKETLPKNAFRQKCTNYHLVLHHWDLAVVLCLQLEWSVKSTSPSNLFDQKGRNAFFVSLHSHPLLPMADVDQKTKTGRHRFLTACITAGVQDCAPDQLPHCGRVYELAREWGVDCGTLRRHQTVQLYMVGKDDLAEKLLPSIEEKALMGSELLLVLGSRLADKINYMETDIWSRIGAKSASWIRAFSSKSNANKPLDVDALEKLLRHVTALLPKTHAEAAIAAELEDVIDVLEESENYSPSSSDA